MTDDPGPKQAKPEPKPPRNAREEALAKALRANLRRRKAGKGSSD